MNTRQAIQTKFLAPTNTRGARVKAFCRAGSMITPWDHSQDVAENHHEAAEALARRLDWSLKGTGFGSLPNGGYALTFPVVP